ncbi:unnamed protein product [Lepeophtheirus salmonis]|uniref:(salmon louse) hypothetical protein n=1 Tax=Lepeophtheirus salmonis TaxID=72036 RepID=A0A7R8CTI7_LEPSM|nr:unnamed protein product [Lepeophtheirus salmonis]CAF2924837.1 unnamed protein product [Lepeophtheirus salmonis]
MTEAPTKGLAKYTYFVRCMVSGCPSPRDVKYHSFPKDPKIRGDWIQSCANSESFNPDRSLVCGRHFVYTDYFGCYEGDDLKFPLGIRLKQGIIPHVSIPCQLEACLMPLDLRLPDPQIEEFNRKRIVEEAIQEYDSVQERAKNGSDIKEAPKPKKRSKFELFISNLSTPNYDCSSEDKSKETSRNKESLLLKKTVKTLRTRVRLLETKVNGLTHTKVFYRKQLRRLQSLKGRREVIYEELGKSLTQSQIRYLIEPRSYQRDYSREEILRGLILRFINPYALRYVRSWSLVCLPSRHTLDVALQKFTFSQGILTDSIIRIRESFDTLKAVNKSLAIISIAEMNIQSCFKFSSKQRKNHESHKTLQIGVVRGLVSDFKEIVFQDFDCELDKKLLFSIIEELEKNTIQVVGINFNIRNHKLFKELNLSQENTIIVNPTDPNRHILIFPDVPNLLKMLRDHLLEEECFFPDASKDKFILLSKQVFKSMITSENEDVKSINKISLRHIRCKGEDRRSTRLASQLLSNTTANALALHLSDTSDPRAIGVSIINNWFDVMNSKCVFNPRCPYSSALGINEEIQLRALNDMEKLIYDLKLMNNSQLPLFQQGILISIMSTKILYQSIVKEDGYVPHIQTFRLNQDFIENIFNRVRQQHLEDIDILSNDEGIHCDDDEVTDENRINTEEEHNVNIEIVESSSESC